MFHQLKVVHINTKVENIQETKKPLVVNCTSRSPDDFKQLSPFYAGPCELEDGRVAHNVENGWQFSKVFPNHIGSCGNIDKAGYKAWSKNGMLATHASRYPFGKGVGAIFSILNKNRLNYVQARQSIYMPLYIQAVRNTPEFKQLKKAYKKDQEIIILDFDAYKHYEDNMSWSDVIHRTDRKMGHGFVLAMMLDVGPDNLLAMIGAHYAIGMSPATADGE